MNTTRLLAWLEDRSDWLSPLLVKEVRQVVRGREFLFSFLACLVAGLIVSFVGATEALAGSNTSGRWTFAALMACLGFLGLAVAPLGSFSTLRNERMEQTLELITLTQLNPRRIVVGKLLSQSVKLLTLFAGIAPFLAMSFLLGGIDFFTILASLVLLFMGSVWAGSVCLFLSTTFKSRAVSGLVFAGVGLGVLFLVVLGSNLFTAVSRGMVPAIIGIGGAPGALMLIKQFALLLTFWLITVVNFVLLAENRLSLTTEDTVTPLRVGFLVQFLAMAGWALVYLNTSSRTDVADVIATAGVMHLAVVAYFVITEEMTVPRRVLQRIRNATGRQRLVVLFGPGGGRGAMYVLAQMLILLTVFAAFRPLPFHQHLLMASLGYICFLTGVPVLMFRRFAPARVSPLKLRVTILVTVAAVLVVPDIVHYVIVRPEILDIEFSVRHLLNPFMTIPNWRSVESSGWYAVPLVIGLTGVLAYIQLFRIGAKTTGQMELTEPRRVPVAGEAGRDSVLN